MANRKRFTLEGKLTVHRRAWRRPEGGKSHQILQVVCEAVHRIWETAKVGIVFQRVSVLQNSARGVVAIDVHYQRIVGPFANGTALPMAAAVKNQPEPVE